jgi:hypothetical protein
MKLPIRLTKYRLLALLILFALLGAYVASLTYQYQILVRGILGLAVLCLILLYAATKRINGSLDALVSRAKISDLILVFLWSGLSYWAALQVIDAVQFIVSG